MSKQSRLRLTFAGLGLAVTVLIYASGWFTLHEDLPKQASILFYVLRLISPLVCPPSLLSAMALDLDPYSVSGATLWLAIGLLNSALWEKLGIVAGRILWKHEGPATT
jgi:hypothetical protein